jgi:hypothetical protein
MPAWLVGIVLFVPVEETVCLPCKYRVASG